MNKIRVRVILCADRKNRIQVSTDNMVWFTVEAGLDGTDALKMAADLYALATNDDPIATHILWKNK